MQRPGRPVALQGQHGRLPQDPPCRGHEGRVYGLEPDLLRLQRKQPLFVSAKSDLLKKTKAQGAFKYGGYEFFKRFYSDLVGEEKAVQWKTSLYLTASASAEFIADVALCPFEAVKVRMQTTLPPDFRSTFAGISSVVSKEGSSG